MILVCGPSLDPESLDVPEGVEVRGYVPALWQHFAACDLAIVQGGGTSTVELTALRRPFVFFPLEEHFEQQIHVAGRLERQGVGIKMQYSQTTPESLAELILPNLGKEVDYPQIRTDGATTAATLISRFL
jgi:UDP:flavonoid glycosyltransferase YjiC (YdhE family)